MNCEVSMGEGWLAEPMKEWKVFFMHPEWPELMFRSRRAQSNDEKAPMVGI